MNENEPIPQWEDRFTEDKEEVANMDKDNLLNLSSRVFLSLHQVKRQVSFPDSGA